MPFSDFITPTGVLPLEQVDMVPPGFTPPSVQAQPGTTLATETIQGSVSPDYPPLPQKLAVIQATAISAAIVTLDLQNSSALLDIVLPDLPPLPHKLTTENIQGGVAPDPPPFPHKLTTEIIQDSVSPDLPPFPHKLASATLLLDVGGPDFPRPKLAPEAPLLDVGLPDLPKPPPK